MNNEYGIFNDEGLVEGSFSSQAEAQRAIEERYDEDDALTVELLCRDHSSNAAEQCEDCDMMGPDELEAALEDCETMNDVRELRRYLFHPRMNGDSNSCLLCNYGCELEDLGNAEAEGHASNCGFRIASARVSLE